MTSRREAVVVTLLSVARAHKKKYCWVSQKKIRELIEKYHGVGLSNRTLNRDLKWLEENGYISRLRRIRVDPQGRLVFCSTLYKFKGKVFNWLYSIRSLVGRLFSFFRLPKWANHQLIQERVSSHSIAGSVEKLLIKERDGTLYEYDPRSGEYLRCS